MTKLLSSGAASKPSLSSGTQYGKFRGGISGGNVSFLKGSCSDRMFVQWYSAYYQASTSPVAQWRSGEL